MCLCVCVCVCVFVCVFVCVCTHTHEWHTRTYLLWRTQGGIGGSCQRLCRIAQNGHICESLKRVARNICGVIRVTPPDSFTTAVLNTPLPISLQLNRKSRGIRKIEACKGFNLKKHFLIRKLMNIWKQAKVREMVAPRRNVYFVKSIAKLFVIPCSKHAICIFVAGIYIALHLFIRNNQQSSRDIQMNSELITWH